ncbi:MAG: glycosyltransferase family 39 protein, partial [Ignavibacteria bacterium]|nr:glycosyltransferase family 39 protein [Ignavibacteria bacterium]
MADAQNSAGQKRISNFSMAVQKKVYWLLLISFAIRAFLAAYLEFGNDEVYYWTYALYPDWSHFDHPPMVGWVMQFFSLNLLFDSEFFLRLASVVFTTINTFLIFLIGKKIKDEVTGFYAALLYTASIYAFVITGIFILPDTPQNLFWMLGIYLMVRLLDENQSIKSWNLTMIGLGLVIGLGMISKYTSVFLWFGIGLYVLFYKRIWLKKPALYFALILSAACTLPVILWNLNNDFISFSFQGERVNIFSSSLRLDYFFRELFGQIAYNNPINFVLVALAVFTIFKGRKWLRSDYQHIILFISIPLIGIFLVFSLFRPTLPHWTGPA